MNLTEQEAISVALIDVMNQYNHTFVSDALREWDRQGQGHFDVFIRDYVDSRWHYMSSLN